MELLPNLPVVLQYKRRQQDKVVPDMQNKMVVIGMTLIRAKQAIVVQI